MDVSFRSVALNKRYPLRISRVNSQDLSICLLLYGRATWTAWVKPPLAA